MSQAISEGLNCLGVFLCGPALAKVGADAPALLQRWNTDCAPRLRLVREVSEGSPATLQSAVVKLSTMIEAGIDVEAADHLASLRRAIREVLTGFGFQLPKVPPGEAAVCELHGDACPVLATGAT